MKKIWGFTIGVLGVAALLGAPRTASAVCQPMYNPEDPSQIVGCCSASGQVMANGANCINPANTCQEGDCLAGTCVQKPDGDWNPTNAGDPCHHPGNPCLIGTCSHQQCLNAVPACVDTNQCTADSCEVNAATPNPLDVTCTNDAAANDGVMCAIPTATSATCERGECDGGSCVGSGITDTCTGTLPDCQVFQCTGYDAQGGLLCMGINAPQFTDCRVNEWTQCKHYECGTNGQCNPDNQTGATCDYSVCQVAQCNVGGTCGGNPATIVNKADGTPCPDNDTVCMIDQCIAGQCNHATPYPLNANRPCINLNPCMTPICAGTGNVCGVPNPAKDGQACSFYCVASGICDGDTGACDPSGGGSCKASTTACNYCGGTCNQDPESGCTCG